MLQCNLSSQMSSYNEYDHLMGGVGFEGGFGQAEFVVLDPIELIEARSVIVQHTCDTLDITEDIAVRLLRQFGWEAERATEIWQSDRLSCCSLLGIQHNLPDSFNIEKDTVCSFCGIRQRLLYHTGCSHLTCTTCLQSYVNSKVQASTSGHFCLDLRCPHQGCEYALQRSLIEETCSSEVIEKLQEHESQSFVDDNPCIVRCPARRCDNVIWCEGVDLSSDKGLNVTCTCGFSFCFHCRREAHAPLKCKTVRELQQRVDAKGASRRKLLDRMKPCPKCKKLANRKAMENDVRCRSCGYRFCWLCLGMWDNQYEDLENTIEFYHHCKFQTRSSYRSDSRQSAIRGTPMSTLQKLRCQLMDQYDTHEKGIQLALMKIVQFRIKLVGTECKSENVVKEWQFLQDSWHHAVSTHIFLKWMYLLGSYLCDRGDDTGKLDNADDALSEASSVPLQLQSVEKLKNEVETSLSFLLKQLDNGLLKLEIQLGNSGFPATNTNACTGGRMIHTRFKLYKLTQKMWEMLVKVVQQEFEEEDGLIKTGRRPSYLSQQISYSEIEENFKIQPVPSTGISNQSPSIFSYGQDANFEQLSQQSPYTSQMLPYYEQQFQPSGSSSVSASESNLRRNSQGSELISRQQSFHYVYQQRSCMNNEMSSSSNEPHNKVVVRDCDSYLLNFENVKLHRNQEDQAPLRQRQQQQQQQVYQTHHLKHDKHEVVSLREYNLKTQIRRGHGNDYIKPEFLQGGWVD